jgi:GNAT superfamily N-acetyltransferase
MVINLIPYEPSWASMREALLEAHMRPIPGPHPFIDEYPIVLHSNDPTSSVLAIDTTTGQLVGHANYWRCKVQGGSPPGAPPLVLGLVGNVVTVPTYRRQGIMPRIIEYLAAQGQRDGVDALVLWSDHKDLYQRVGFFPWGHERRWFLQAHTTLCAPPPTDPATLSDQDLHHMQELRPKSPGIATLARPLNDMRLLLKIPQQTLYLRRDPNDIITDFALYGRGSDFPGAIHEWGSVHPASFVEWVRQWPIISTALLLSPDNLAEVWENALGRYMLRVERHSMAWARPLSAKFTAQTRIFIWGLDSI